MNTVFKSVFEEGLTRAQLAAIWAKQGAKGGTGIGIRGAGVNPRTKSTTLTTSGGTRVLLTTGTDLGWKNFAKRGTALRSNAAKAVRSFRKENPGTRARSVFGNVRTGKYVATQTKYIGPAR